MSPMTGASSTGSPNRRPSAPPELGIVIIGRNEGERFKRCVASVMPVSGLVVYVDSGSTDGSVEWARSAGAMVVELDLQVPFTAARARNAGFGHLRTAAPGMEFVFFVDGDCEVVAEWPHAAQAFLQARPDVAAVCGRRRERYPERSVYNRLCDLEWDTPVGPTRSCGGDVVMRSEALAAVGGYREDLIAGEEPELCVRLRGAGWLVWRLDVEMTLHDADMDRFRQWWKRAQRSGHAFAQGAFLHGAPPERHNVAQTRRALAWGAVFPLIVVALSAWKPVCIALLSVYPLQVLRLALRDGIARPERRWHALFLVLARFPEAQGVLQFWFNRVRRRRSALIEYKA